MPWGIVSVPWWDRKYALGDRKCTLGDRKCTLGDRKPVRVSLATLRMLALACTVNTYRSRASLVCMWEFGSTSVIARIVCR